MLITAIKFCLLLLIQAVVLYLATLAGVCDRTLQALGVPALDDQVRRAPGACHASHQELPCTEGWPTSVPPLHMR